MLNSHCRPLPLIASEISRYKNSLISPGQAYAQAELKNYKQIAKIYDEYEAYLHENNLVDFDDLLALTFKLLDENEELAKRTSEQYQYIMIDEYQDTNELQFRLLKKLCSTHNNLCVVGDDDQSIYGWRGANVRNILEFHEDFEDTVVVKLEENYRSRASILKVANELIQHNRSRLGKKLIARSTILSARVSPLKRSPYFTVSMHCHVHSKRVLTVQVLPTN